MPYVRKATEAKTEPQKKNEGMLRSVFYIFFGTCIEDCDKEGSFRGFPSPCIGGVRFVGVVSHLIIVAGWQISGRSLMSALGQKRPLTKLLRGACG